jgi:two-component system response regulator FlrC
MIKLNGLKILVVEDDPDLNEVICDFLSSANANVLSATNGQHALAILETETVNFILSDIQMPIMNGFEFLKNIQKSKSQKPPLVFVTGQSTVTDLEAKNIGALGLINKPFNKDILLQTMAKILLEGHHKTTSLN